MLTFNEIGFLEDPVLKCAEIAVEHRASPLLFVGSSDSEVAGFIDATAELRFVLPAEGAVYNGARCATKRAHLAHLLADGRNIAIKSGLFNYFDGALLKAAWYNGYTLLSPGDAIVWADKIGAYSNENLEEAIRRKQLIAVAQDTFLLSPAHKDAYVLDKLGIPAHTHNGRLLTRLTANGHTALYWTPQLYLVYAFRRAHVVHPMPSASALMAYLRVFGVPCGVEEGDREQNRRLASLLRVVFEDRFNKRGEDDAAYSPRWYAHRQALEDVFRDMRNVLLYTEAGGEKRDLVAYTMPNETLRTVDESNIRPVFRGRGFPAADCGGYASARVLCYCANPRFPAACAGYFRKNETGFDQDAYALTHMLRWISRSAVRNGDPVTVYVPSKRMRGLLGGWIKSQGG